jgi:Jacalin-like lectin domain
MQQKEIPIKLNSMGYYTSDTKWDDGGHNKINKIIISTRKSRISFIRVVYEDTYETKVICPEREARSSLFKVIFL